MLKRFVMGMLVCALLVFGAAAALAEAEYVEMVAEANAYYGQMVDGEMSGFGIYEVTGGSVYYGEFQHTKLTGVGVNVYPEGEPNNAQHRSGTFLNNKGDGTNVTMIRDQTRYEASYQMGTVVPGTTTVTQLAYEWCDNLPLPGGNTYLGEMFAGGNLPNGYGVMFYADGGIYAGAFENGLRHGQGIYMDANKNSVSGLWERDAVAQVNRMVITDPTHSLDSVIREDQQISADDYASMEQIVDSAVNSVYFVKVYDQNNAEFGTGSGFLLYDSQTFVTNHHVIKDASSLVAISDDGQHQYTLDELLYADEGEDLAILRFPAQADEKPLMCSAEEARRGQNVIAIGSPMGIRNTVSTGIISGYGRLTSKTTPSLQISAPISSGSSGGALLNMRGEVIGVTCSGLESGQNLNFAIPIAVVDRLHQPENLRPQTLREYNQLGDPIPMIENLRADLDGDAIKLSWSVVPGAERYEVHATSPSAPDAPQMLAQIRVRAGDTASFTHKDSTQNPTFAYQFLIFAIGADGQLIAVDGGQISVLDLMLQ